MNKVYSMVGTSEAAVRKFAIGSAFRTGGRAAETGFCTVDSMEWDPFYKGIFISVPQPKTHKIKGIMLMAGENRHQCHFLDFGVPPPSNLTSTLPLNPHLHLVSEPSPPPLKFLTSTQIQNPHLPGFR